METIILGLLVLQLIVIICIFISFGASLDEIKYVLRIKKKL